MPLTTPPPETLAGLSLDAVARLAEAGGLPPVERWNPRHCGDSAMRILPDGAWLHEGTPIARPAMVRLFSTILRGEADGSHVLVTPAEKLTIEVVDAPFVAVELTAEGAGRDMRLAFRTNVGDVVIAGAAHPIAISDRGHGAHPYLRVRGRLDALVARPVYYELAALALDGAPGPDGTTGLWSDGAFFPLGAGDAVGDDAAGGG